MSSGSSTEISSGTFTRLVSSKRDKKMPDILRSSGKRYLKRKEDKESIDGSLIVDLSQGVTTFGNHTGDTPLPAPISSHHNTVYYYDE